MLKGVPDVGFSSYAAPAYDLVPKDIQQGCGHLVMCNAISFSVQCSVFGAEHTDGVWSIGSGNKLSRSCTQS